MTELNTRLNEARANVATLQKMRQAETELEQLEAEARRQNDRGTWQAELAQVDNRIGKVAGDYRRAVKRRDSAIFGLCQELRYVLTEVRSTLALGEELATLAQQKASLQWSISNPEGITPGTASEVRDVIRDAGNQELINRGIWPLGSYHATSRDNVIRAVLGALAKLVAIPVQWPRAEPAKINVVLHDGTQVQEHVS